MHMGVRPMFKSWSHHYRLCDLGEATYSLINSVFKAQGNKGAPFSKGCFKPSAGKLLNYDPVQSAFNTSTELNSPK